MYVSDTLLQDWTLLFHLVHQLLFPGWLQWYVSWSIKEEETTIMSSLGVGQEWKWEDVWPSVCCQLWEQYWQQHCLNWTAMYSFVIYYSLKQCKATQCSAGGSTWYLWRWGSECRDLGNRRAIVLHRTLLYCMAMHITTMHCNILHCTSLHGVTLQCNALNSTTLHYTALHCKALHCTIVQCNAFYCSALAVLYLYVLHCNRLGSHPVLDIDTFISGQEKGLGGDLYTVMGSSVLQCKRQYTLQCTLYCTVHCTFHCTLHSTLHRTLQCTLYFKMYWTL